MVMKNFDTLQVLIIYTCQIRDLSNDAHAAAILHEGAKQYIAQATQIPKYLSHMLLII